MPHPFRAAAVALALAVAAAAPLRAQDLHSTQLAKQLDALLTAHGLDAIAAANPQAPNRFVAALAFPNSQLLVVDAIYPAPARLQQQIAEANYRDVYLALHQAGVADSKLFFLDLGYDGLRGHDGAVDVLYRGATEQIMFDGQPEKHNLSKSAYDKELATAEATYGRLLTVLVNSLKASTTE